MVRQVRITPEDKMAIPGGKMAPRSGLSLQYAFIPPKIREYFDLKVDDLLKFDVVEKRMLLRL